MRVITLWQPWCSLILSGAKVFETRSWAPSVDVIGQKIAIHAAARAPFTDLHSEPNKAITDVLGVGWQQSLPRGVILLTATVAGAYQIESVSQFGDAFIGKSVEGSPYLKSFVIDHFGDYTPGRWVWKLEDVSPVDPPVPFKGKQGWGKWEPEFS